MVLLAVTGEAQPRQNSDFGSKFFDDLQVLFGRLQQAELDEAFQQAKPIHCSDLVGAKGEWKEVAFLNDDRSLGNWHRTSIDESRPKKDLAAFVFSGICSGEDDPVAVATSYPVKATVDQFHDGKIQFSQIVIKSNPPVGVTFDQFTNAYTFQLPYLYIRSQNAAATLYTLIPPQTNSKQVKAVSEEFRCKALSDPELTYRFLLCRTRLSDSGLRSARQPLGNAAYYILSDGKEASATVKLMFGAGAEADRAAEKNWTLTALPLHMVDVGNDEFRLRFNPAVVEWKNRQAPIAGRTGDLGLHAGVATAQPQSVLLPLAAGHIASGQTPSRKERHGFPALLPRILAGIRDSDFRRFRNREQHRSAHGNASVLFPPKRDGGGCPGRSLDPHRRPIHRTGSADASPHRRRALRDWIKVRSNATAFPDSKVGSAL